MGNKLKAIFFTCAMSLLFVMAITLGNINFDGDDVANPVFANLAVHVGNHYKAKEATCTEEGSREYWVCCECHQTFLDGESSEVMEGSWTDTNKTGDQGVGGISSSALLPALGHEWIYSSDVQGRYRTCSRCNLVERSWDEEEESHPDYDYEILNNGNAALISYKGKTLPLVEIPTTINDRNVEKIKSGCFHKSQEAQPNNAKRKIADTPSNEDESSGSSYYIPASIAEIEDDSFNDGSIFVTDASSKNEGWVDDALGESATDAEGNIYFEVERQDTIVEDGIVYVYKPHLLNYILANCLVERTEVVVPSEIAGYKVTEIGAHAFAGNIHMESVSIPRTIGWIRTEAFYGCTSLGSLYLDCPNLTDILNRAFAGCTSLDVVQLPENCISLRRYAFADCGYISEFYMPSSVSGIYPTTFDGTTIGTLHYGGTQSQFEELILPKVEEDTFDGTEILYEGNQEFVVANHVRDVFEMEANTLVRVTARIGGFAEGYGNSYKRLMLVDPETNDVLTCYGKAPLYNLSDIGKEITVTGTLVFYAGQAEITNYEYSLSDGDPIELHPFVLDLTDTDFDPATYTNKLCTFDATISEVGSKDHHFQETDSIIGWANKPGYYGDTLYVGEHVTITGFLIYYNQTPELYFDYRQVIRDHKHAFYLTEDRPTKLEFDREDNMHRLDSLLGSGSSFAINMDDEHTFLPAQYIVDALNDTDILEVDQDNEFYVNVLEGGSFGFSILDKDEITADDIFITYTEADVPVPVDPDPVDPTVSVEGWGLRKVIEKKNLRDDWLEEFEVDEETDSYVFEGLFIKGTQLHVALNMCDFGLSLTQPLVDAVGDESILSLPTSLTYPQVNRTGHFTIRIRRMPTFEESCHNVSVEFSPQEGQIHTWRFWGEGRLWSPQEDLSYDPETGLHTISIRLIEGDRFTISSQNEELNCPDARNLLVRCANLKKLIVIPKGDYIPVVQKSGTYHFSLSDEMAVIGYSAVGTMVDEAWTDGVAATFEAMEEPSQSPFTVKTFDAQGAEIEETPFEYDAVTKEHVVCIHLNEGEEAEISENDLPTINVMYSLSYEGDKQDCLTFDYETERLKSDQKGDYTFIIPQEYLFLYPDCYENVPMPRTIFDSSVLSERFGGEMDIAIPDNVSVIEDGEFKNCITLTSVNIGGNVIEIGDSAFEHCWSLETVVIPSSVTRIGSSAFKDCTALKSIIIPDSVIEIGQEAFKGCTSLESVTLPASLTRIETGTFEGCSSLASIDIPDTLTRIGDSAFLGAALKSIIIPDSVIEIGQEAFKGCTSLESVTLPASLTRIETGTFEGCSSLASIDIPDTLTRIGDSAFQGVALESVLIPEGVTYVGEYAFGACSFLKSVTFLSAEPPEIQPEVFWGVLEGEDFYVFVPAGSVEAYQAVAEESWRIFIVEII